MKTSKAKDKVVGLLQECQENGVEGISITELISLLYLRSFLKQVKEDPSILTFRNEVLLVRKAQGKELSQEFAEPIVDALNELKNEKRIFISSPDELIFLRDIK